MGKFTAAQIKEHAEKAMASFDDGFQWTDLLNLIPAVMEIVGSVKEMSGQEKQASAEAILDYVIDETDIPWVPDSFVDPILKKAVRVIIPMLFRAHEGEFQFKPTETSGNSN